MARREMFKRDLAFFGSRIDRSSSSPADTMFRRPGLSAHLVVGRLPSSALTLALLSSLDYVL
jgi:hypothetical protein